MASSTSPSELAYRVMLELLCARPSFRKTDLQAAIKAAAAERAESEAEKKKGGSGSGGAEQKRQQQHQPLSEAQLTRVVKTLCRSRGNQWCLKEVDGRE